MLPAIKAGSAPRYHRIFAVPGDFQRENASVSVKDSSDSLPHGSHLLELATTNGDCPGRDILCLVRKRQRIVLYVYKEDKSNDMNIETAQPPSWCVAA